MTTRRATCTRRASRGRATRSLIAEIYAEIYAEICAEMHPSLCQVCKCAERCLTNNNTLTTTTGRHNNRAPHPPHHNNNTATQVRKCAERCLTALSETSDIRPRVKQTVRVCREK